MSGNRWPDLSRRLAQDHSPFRLSGGQGALLLVALGVVAFRGLIYDPWVDGPLGAHRSAQALLVVAAAAAWLLVRLAGDSRSLLPWAAALAVLTPSVLVDVVRQSGAIARTREYVLRDDFRPPAAALDGERWLAELQPGASVQVSEGQLTIRAPANVLGFAGLRLARELDPNRNLYWLPRGAFEMPSGEVLEWQGRVERENRLAVILDTRTTRIEATEFGLRVTYLLLDGALDGTDIEAPEVARGETLSYRLERTDAHPLQRLLLNEREVWARPKPPGAWEFARFGATRTGDEHGSTLTVGAVRYRALFGPAGSGSRSGCPEGKLFCAG